MATTLRPSRPCTADGVNILGRFCHSLPLTFEGNGAGHLERACGVLAQLIDASLTAVFLVAGGVQAAFLLFLIAGQTLG